MKNPAVLEYPRSVQKLKEGFDLLAHTLGLTLGPTQGIVLSSTELKSKPELLSDAATIARRVTDLADAEQNVGAMLLRNLVWRVHERVGDGGALAAVLAQAMLQRAARNLAAGANPVLLNHGIREATRAAVAALRQFSQPAAGEADLTAVARATTGQEALSRVLGEMFDLLGSHAYITVEDYMAPYLERVYLDGGRWQGNLISPYLVTAPVTGRAIQADCRVALYEGTLEGAEDIRAMLEAAGRADDVDARRPVLLVAHKISGEALNLLAATHQQTALKIVAVSLKRIGEKAHLDLADLAVLSGAQIVSPIMGRRLAHIRPGDFGRARRVEAGAEDLFVVGGGGDQAQVRQEIERLHAQAKSLQPGEEGLGELEMRLGRLSGSAGVLKIGALTQAERDFLHQRAEQGIKALRATLSDGLLPGGGAAYLHCIERVREQTGDLREEALMGARVVADALQAPFRAILRNAGIDAPGPIQEELLNRPLGYFYDVVQRQVLPARQAGVLDPTLVLVAALESAASGAMMALSTQSIVLKRKPRMSYEP
jgi:chaperonin GroEL